MAVAAQSSTRLSRVVPGPGNPPKTREIRVGLVMYGGVSLAIYINGVAREFFRAVHGNGFYKLLKRLVDADIVVDVLSGTSAGGINGVFLAYALTNGKDFSGMARLWREHGDIGRLLRDPDALPDPCPSALDSEGYYHRELRRAFATLPSYANPEDEPSRLTELDLFVTSTNIDGEIYTTFDDAGHAIDVKDHRSVFLLKHRSGRKHPFEPATAEADETDPTHEALARLSRMTSAFPAAFQSVEVREPAWDGGGDAKMRDAHDRLRTWGRLGKRTFFIDGGALDNKPFSYTTREIAKRALTRKIERYLFYVEPDPEKFDAEKLKTRETYPSFLNTAYAGTLGVPSYESISDDLQLIADQNTRVQQYRTIAEGVTKAVLEGNGEDPTGEVSYKIHRNARLLQISRGALRGVLKERQEWLPSGDPEGQAKREAASRLIQAFGEYVKQSRPGNEEGVETLRDFDVFFHERRLDHVANYIYSKLDVTRDTKNENGNAIARLLQQINRMRKLVEIVHFHMDQTVDEAQIDWHGVLQDARLPEAAKAIWDDVKALLRHTLNVDPESPVIGEWKGKLVAIPTPQDPMNPPLDQPTLDAIHLSLAARRHSKIRHSHDEPFHSLLRICESHAKAVIDASLPELPQEVASAVHRIWERYESIDALLFPMQMLSGVGEQVVINTVRISPMDAQRAFSKLSLQEKVAGDDLAHFSGFLKRSWRSNDILWGRLDAVCQLTECLLSEKRLNTILATASQREAMRRLIGAGYPSVQALVDQIFPSALPASRAAVAQWIDELTDADEVLSRRARTEILQERVDLLIGLAQLEILGEEVPEVYADQLQEAQEWNNSPSIHAAAAGDAAALAVSRVASDVLEVPNSTAAALRERLVRVLRKPRVLPNHVPTAFDTPLGAFFRSSYRVGSESVQNSVPPTVLLEIIFKALLVVRSALVSSLSKSARKWIEGSAIFKFAIDLPLRVGHALAVTVRKEHRMGAFFRTVAATTAIVAVILALLPKTGFQMGTKLILLLAALIVMTIIAKLSLKQMAFTAAKWGAVAAALLLLALWLRNDPVIIRHKGKEWRFPAAAQTASQTADTTASGNR